MKETADQKAIYVDQYELNREIQIRNDLINVVNQISTRLASVDIILTPEILQDFSADINIVSGLLLKKLQEQDPKQFDLLQAVYNESTHRKINDLNLSPLHIQFNRLISEAGISPLQITMKNGKAELSKKERQEITEKHSVYLSEEDRQLYDKVQAFVKTYSDLQEFIRDREPDADLGDILRNGLNDFTVNSKGAILSGNLIVAQFHEKGNCTDLMVNPLFFSKNINISL